MGQQVHKAITSDYFFHSFHMVLGIGPPPQRKTSEARQLCVLSGSNATLSHKASILLMLKSL